MNKKILISLTILTIAAFLSGCGKDIPIPSAASPTPTSVPPEVTVLPAFTATPSEPTATPIPLSAQVNGDGITLVEYQIELQSFQKAQLEVGADLVEFQAASTEQLVLDNMIDETLLAQAAIQSGFILDEAALQSRLDALANQAGGAQALSDWLQNQGYSEEIFRQALKRSIQAAWMRDQITASLPETALQVHARQILLYNLDQANQVYALLQSGQDFKATAFYYDPVAGGDLGWAPRGYLAEKAIEEAAFQFNPGEYSPVIETRLGFHIVQVIEVDAQRVLDPDARETLQIQTLVQWLQERRAQSNIVILVP